MFAKNPPNRSVDSPPRRRTQEKRVLGRPSALPPASPGTAFGGEMSAFQSSGISVQTKPGIPTPHRLLPEAGHLHGPMALTSEGWVFPRAPRLQHLTPLTQLLHKLLSPIPESRVRHHQSVGKTRENLQLVSGQSFITPPTWGEANTASLRPISSQVFRSARVGVASVPLCPRGEDEV